MNGKSQLNRSTRLGVKACFKGDASILPAFERAATSLTRSGRLEACPTLANPISNHFLVAFLIAALGFAGCGRQESAAGAAGGTTSQRPVEIRVKGSDTMVQLATAWAEAYRKVKPNVFVNASGGGTGTGFAALQNNTTDICDASRDIKPEEAEKTKSVTGKEVKEFVVGYDALAVYAHPSNPIKEISVEELREIWAEGGTIGTWEQLNPAFQGKIVLFGRQNNSGTYDYFREHVCGKKDGKQREFRGGISELNGSAEVVENVAKTPLGLGYSGMGYKTPTVNWLKVSGKKGEPAVEPGVDVARSGKYPIARKLYLYTAGEPAGEVKAYIDWILSPEGQKIVEKEGFVPLN
ncbi:MAG: PstS family phosphate ABC transporter substrate-binding protein [Verrucomicrobia bacterium]|nr:PstS family phosphate ABC transporter substrate-binding protein [Verrucomicrobiota bacterium]